MVIRHRSFVECDLRGDTEFDVVVHEGDAGREQYCGKGLIRWSVDQLIVIELDVRIHVTQRPRQANIVDVVTEIRQRIFDDVVCEQLVPGMAAKCRSIAYVSLKRERPQVLDDSSVRKIAETLGPQQLRAEQGVILLFNRRTAGRNHELGAERKPQLVFGNRQKGDFWQQLKVVEAGLSLAFLWRLLNPFTLN